MKYIKGYKLFESSDDIKILFSSINDSEFDLDVKNNVVSITKKRSSGRNVLKSIFTEDDRYEVNSIIEQVLSIGDYELDGEIEYQQKKGSILSNPTTGKTILTGKVTDIDIKSFMSDNSLDQTEFIINTNGLSSYKIPRSNYSVGENDKPFTTQMLVDNAKENDESRILGNSMRKMTLFKRGDSDYHCFLYKRKGGYSEYGRYTIEYILIHKDEVSDIITPSIYKVKIKLSNKQL